MGTIRKIIGVLIILYGLVQIARGILTLGLGVDPVSLFFLGTDPSIENLLAVGLSAFANTLVAGIFIGIGLVAIIIGLVVKGKDD